MWKLKCLNNKENTTTGQFLRFCIPIIPVMILCMFFIKLIVNIAFSRLITPFYASFHNILLTILYYCIPTFTERTLDDTLNLVKTACLQGIKWIVIICAIIVLVMTGLEAYLNEVVGKNSMAHSTYVIKTYTIQISMFFLRLFIIIFITNFIMKYYINWLAIRLWNTSKIYATKYILYALSVR